MPVGPEVPRQERIRGGQPVPEVTRQQFEKERAADDALLERIRRGQPVVPGPMDLMFAKQRRYGAWVCRRLGRAVHDGDDYFLGKLVKAIRVGRKIARRQAENELIRRLSEQWMTKKQVTREVAKRMRKRIRKLRTKLKAGRRRSENAQRQIKTSLKGAKARLKRRFSSQKMTARQIAEEVRKRTGYRIGENTIRQRLGRMRKKA